MCEFNCSIVFLTKMVTVLLLLCHRIKLTFSLVTWTMRIVCLLVRQPNTKRGFRVRMMFYWCFTNLSMSRSIIQLMTLCHPWGIFVAAKIQNGRHLKLFFSITSILQDIGGLFWCLNIGWWGQIIYLSSAENSLNIILQIRRPEFKMAATKTCLSL